jgi:hypothetical protein
MDVVLYAADTQGGRIEVAARPAEVFVEFGPQRRIVKERGPVLGGEDDVEADLGQGLRHERFSGGDATPSG